MAFKHLSSEERHYIEIELKNGTSQNKIAQKLGRDQSSLSRELGRNKGLRGYRHQQAHRMAQQRHQEKTKAVKLTDDIKRRISNDIRADLSPEQVAGRLKKEGVIELHHETIYQYIADDKRKGGTLYKHLRHQKKTYRKRYGSAHNRTGIPNRVGIEERPAVVNNRERVGDWEADTIIGKNHKGAIATLDERKTKLRLAVPLPGKKAKAVKQAMIGVLKPLKKFVKTITYDNGKEFVQHEEVAKALKCDSYFAAPYHSWERGQNENANGLLRQYFPKSMELNNVTEKEVIIAVDKLNNRPRKCLDYKTPYEAFKEFTGIDVRKVMGYVFIT
ncbi:IS30 family transposase [Endozoicomonas ascidiicola]|uniref:IS30 family transposase n=1 Tax=Endozoicomonas ascidiicola TaxID=1698521 RepID=UPI000830B95B|nr:IS30 family transposase [Endozoicomonas ascidiicola]